MKLTDGLIYHNLTDITIDYPMLVTHVGQFVEALISLQNFTGPVFPELFSQFNMTVNNFRYQAAIERIASQDLSQ